MNCALAELDRMKRPCSSRGWLEDDVELEAPPEVPMWHTLSALMQLLPQGMPFVHCFGAVAVLVEPVLVELMLVELVLVEPMWHTLSALMQLLPQGMPLVQCF